MQTALQELASGTPNAAGDAQLVFNPTRESEVWTGSIIISSSLGNVLTSKTIAPIRWEAKDNGNTIGVWFNDLPSPTMQAKGQVIVAGSNIGNAEKLNARFFGVQTGLNDTPIVWPSPPPPPPASVPKVIVSNNIALPAGTNAIGSSQPVVVGTSLEIFECITALQGAGSAVRLAIQWSVDNSFVDPIEYDFDLGATSQMRGLILPNLAPFVRFLGLTGAGQEQISLTVLTGLPPITRPPIIPNGVLFNQALPVGNSVIGIPPYIGPAVVMMYPNNAAGFGIDILSQDYLSVTQAIVRQEQGWPGGTGPFVSSGVVYLPPLINAVRITGAPAGAQVSGVALGP